jgi:hypothetical protein
MSCSESTPVEIIREGGTAIWVRMWVDNESRLYTRICFPDFHPIWRYYPDNPALASSYNFADQEKLEGLFQELGGYRNE